MRLIPQLRICLAAAVLLLHGSNLSAQLRDSFESPQPSWSLKQADCGVRELLHERTFREARTGQSSEHFRLELGTGTFAYLAHSIGRAPLIQEFQPSLFIKADRPSLQLLARVVFPRSLDRGTGRPITSFLRGDTYTDVSNWQRLSIKDAGRLLEQEVRSLRAQFGSEIDAREAYIDLIAVNAYSAPGPLDVWLDDLEIEGYLNLEADNAPSPPGAPARAIALSTPSSASESALETPSATVQGSLLLVRGRPFMTRAVQHRGEPLEWLKGLGFNTVKLSSSPSPADLKEAQRLGIWLIAPPPYENLPAGAAALNSMLAWSLGERLTERDLIGTRDMLREIRALDPRQDRPIFAGVDVQLDEYSRLANLLLLERPALGTSQELSELRQWSLVRSRLARPGTLMLASVQAQRLPRLGEQLVLFGRGAAWQEDCDPEQLRLQALQAIAAGARGSVVHTEQPLAIDTGAAAMRTDALRLLNMELKLLEPWVAAANVTEELAAGDGVVQVSILAAERSRLLVVTQHGSAGQFVLGPPPRNSLVVMAPGIGTTDQAFLVSLAGVKPLKITRSGTGARIVIDDAPHAAAIAITQDPLAIHHLRTVLAEHRGDAGRLRHDLTSRRLAQTAEIDRQLAELGHPLAQASDWLSKAQASLEQARQMLEKNDFENADVATRKAEQWLARVRRGHWEQTAAAFPSPAASPCIAQFTTLPLHWAVAERMGRGQWGPNVQAAGDMESLDQMLKAGWRQQRPPADRIGADVSLSLSDPRAGRSALRLQTWAADPKAGAAPQERPPLWITSSPVPVRQGQLVRIRGWVNVPRRMPGPGEGLLIFDSVGGPDLGDYVRATQGWRQFTLYRAVPASGDLSVTFSLNGLGEASIDDLSVSLLDADPIRQVPQ